MRQAEESLDDVAQRTLIEFPRNIVLEEAKSFLASFAANHNYRLSYTASRRESVGSLQGSKEDGSAELKGVGLEGQVSMASGSGFEFERSQSDSLRFEAVRFERVPGWRLSDYSREAIQVWDDMREERDSYFSE